MVNLFLPMNPQMIRRIISTILVFTFTATTMPCVEPLTAQLAPQTRIPTTELREEFTNTYRDNGGEVYSILPILTTNGESVVSNTLHYILNDPLLLVTSLISLGMIYILFAMAPRTEFGRMVRSKQTLKERTIYNALGLIDIIMMPLSVIAYRFLWSNPPLNSQDWGFAGKFAVVMGSVIIPCAAIYLLADWFAYKVLLNKNGYRLFPPKPPPQKKVSHRGRISQRRPERQESKKWISDAIYFRISERAAEECKRLDEGREYHYEIDQSKLQKDKGELVFYDAYKARRWGNPLFWFCPASLIIEMVVKDCYRSYIIKKIPPSAIGTVAGSETGSSGGADMGIWRGHAGGGGGGGSEGSITGVGGPEALSRSSAGVANRTLASLLTAIHIDNSSHPLLERCDAEGNLDRKIENLEALLEFTDGERARLNELIDGYFEHERLVHRIKGHYVTEGRIKLLSRSGWTIFSYNKLQGVLHQVIYSSIDGEGIDFMSAFGEGSGGLETSLDDLFGSGDSVSMTLEAFENLDSVLGSGFENTGIAIVYSRDLEERAAIASVDALDEDYLSEGYAIFGGQIDPDSERQLLQEVLTLDGIRRLRKEMMLRQGMKETQLRLVQTISQGPFSPREAIIANGIQGRHIEAIVVSDDIFEVVDSIIGPSMRGALIRASEYFRANERLQAAQGIKEEIIRIIEAATQRRMIRSGISSGWPMSGNFGNRPAAASP